MKSSNQLTAAAFMDESGKARRVPRGGWLKAVREAKGMAQTELATKLGFKRQAWAQFEASEARDAISLASLRRAADVLGCDVMYFVIPRQAASLGMEQPAVSARLGSRGTPAIDSSVTAKRLKAAMTEGQPGAETPAWSESELPTELR